MKNLFTLVILLCPALYGWADEENTAKKATDAHITGHIILKETGEHLPFMTILLKEPISARPRTKPDISS